MKLDYDLLISPYPLYLQNIGHIKCPTLREIWDPHITYQKYSLYLSLLLMTPQSYFENINPNSFAWYESLSETDRMSLTMVDVIQNEPELQRRFCDVFNFFFEESVMWDPDEGVFITYTGTDTGRSIVPRGVIHREIFTELCDVILQRCGVGRSDIESINPSKIKNKRALAILNKIQNQKKKIRPKADGDMELPNLITAVSVKSNSINYINIWDLTVFQLQEHFRRECLNIYFDIQAMSVAAYGNEKKTFKGNEWYTNNN